MLLLKYLLMIIGWGLVGWAAAIAVNNLNKVVQYHRRLRTHIAPESVPVKPQLDWATAKWAFLGGLAAAFSRCGHSGGAQRDGWRQSEPDLGDTSKHALSRRALDHAAGRLSCHQRSARLRQAAERKKRLTVGAHVHSEPGSATRHPLARRPKSLETAPQLRQRCSDSHWFL